MRTFIDLCFRICIFVLTGFHLANATFVDSPDKALHFLQAYGANLHPKCFESTSVSKAKRSCILPTTGQKPGLDEEAQIGATTIVDDQRNNKKHVEKSAQEDEFLASLAFLLVTLHNSQMYSVTDQQSLLASIHKTNVINEPAVIKIGEKVDQIREQQKSWIPSTTRELISTARQGTSSVIEVISIVGLLILAKSFKWI